ncbi:helix-turn-helix domain-containing protein [Kineococcus gynurae]|uniref:Helix-turn-helix domain-containing protein n=1 Tax=Kineococcus gynurae TaxID=452979 RepID=A0ABV5LW58_9ACTN
MSADAPIGARLRAVRQARRMTVEDVAAASGVTKGFLSRLERDRTGASVAALIRICETLDIGVSSLFEPAPAGEVVRAGNHPRVNFGGTDMTEYLLTPRGEQRISALLSEIAPGGGAGLELYELPGDVEFAYVLEGTLDLHFENEPSVELATGDAFTFSPTRPHTFVAGTGGCRVLWVISPGTLDVTRG